MTFQVEAEDLTAHASHLDGLADRFDTAISAAEQAMSDDAYGLLCSFLPPIINPMEEEGMDAIKAAKEGVTITADNVRQTAKEYQETDEAGADNFGKFDDAVRVKESAVAQLGVPAAAGMTSASGSPGISPNSESIASTTPSGFNGASSGASQGEPQEFAGRSASGPAMNSDDETSAQKQGTPMQRLEPFQQAEGAQLAEPKQMVSGTHERAELAEPKQLAEPMQRVEAKQAEPMRLAEPVQQFEPKQMSEGAQRFEPKQMSEGAQRPEPFQQAEPMQRFEATRATPASFSEPLQPVQQGVPAGSSEPLRPMNQGAPASFSEPLQPTHQGIPASAPSGTTSAEGAATNYHTAMRAEGTDAPVRNREA